ncbi:hypothetical protein ABZW10_32880 [Kitasatospora sp. NPDC004723]|uniref:hypothetical protein n=1 Tax=Kitasatospora sp. NPDC004723 TaxID=3154288 RepID=UPI0033B2CC3F
MTRLDIDPEMHMYDCPGTLPGGRGCELCKDWEGRTFEELRRELAGLPPLAPVSPPAPAEAPEPPRGCRDLDHCERLMYEGGTCTCDSPDDYDREPSNMADLEDGVDHRW